MNKKTELNGVRQRFDMDSSGLFLENTQHISDDFLRNIQEQRNASTGRREGDYMRVASIPVVIVEKWMKEGFDIMSGEHSAAEIVKRLKAENLEAFLTTEKSV